MSFSGTSQALALSNSFPPRLTIARAGQQLPLLDRAGAQAGQSLCASQDLLMGSQASVELPICRHCCFLFFFNQRDIINLCPYYRKKGEEIQKGGSFFFLEMRNISMCLISKIFFKKVSDFRKVTSYLLLSRALHFCSIRHTDLQTLSQLNQNSIESHLPAISCIYLIFSPTLFTQLSVSGTTSSLP